MGGVRPIWCKRIGRKADRGDPEWGIRPHGEICDDPLVSGNRTGWETYTYRFAHVSSLTTQGW